MASQKRNTRVALYLRVSTTDKGQETDNQLLQLEERCSEYGWVIYDTYIDQESGRKGRRERGDFGRMFDDAARRKFDLVLFWSLDRFTREGIQKTIFYLQQLDHYGVRFKSHTEPLLDTDNELVAHIIIAVLSYLAEQEAVKISERTKAGLERARVQGKTLGRPSKREQWQGKIATMKDQGYSNNRISRETGLSVNTVKKYLEQTGNI